MSQAIAFLLRRINPKHIIIEVHSYSGLHEALLVNGRPDAFVMEPLITGISGTKCIQQIKSNYPDTPLILLSSVPSAEAKKACLAAGADLYVEKTAPIKEITEMVSIYIDDRKDIDPSKAVPPRGGVKLSKRQKQLLVLIDSGLNNEDVAKRLEISPHTVKVHLWRFYKKLGISSRTQLVKFARDNGYL